MVKDCSCGSAGEQVVEAVMHIVKRGYCRSCAQKVEGSDKGVDAFFAVVYSVQVQVSLSAGSLTCMSGGP